MRADYFSVELVVYLSDQTVSNCASFALGATARAVEAAAAYLCLQTLSG